jgi:hypothetical protein
MTAIYDFSLSVSSYFLMRWGFVDQLLTALQFQADEINPRNVRTGNSSDIGHASSAARDDLIYTLAGEMESPVVELMKSQRQRPMAPHAHTHAAYT